MKTLTLLAVIGLFLLGAFAEDNLTLLQRAESGDAEAQYELAHKYEYGEVGYAHDPDLAEVWYKKAFASYQTAAEAGDPKAQYMLGQCYDYERGVKGDIVLQVQWYRKAAEAGNIEAQASLGFAYINGQGVEKDVAKGLEWITKAADQGYARAQEVLGRIYKEGKEVAKDEALSKMWFSKAAENCRAKAVQGDLDSKYVLGNYYLYGLGVEKNFTEAKRIFEEAAEQGDARVQMKLAQGYETGFDESRSGIDKEKSNYWYEKAVETSSVLALMSQGYSHLRTEYGYQDIPKSIWFYEKAADRGSAEAQKALGDIYLGVTYGVDNEWRDYKKAVNWYRKAAEQGNADAQDRLGDCYERGHGVEKNEALAQEWRAKSFARHLEKANNGDLDEMSTVAYRYLEGDGVTKDPDAALAWYQKAADTGDAWAQHMLGRAYLNDDIGEPDRAKAIQWYRKAAEQGEINSQGALGRELLNGDEEDIQDGIYWLKKAVAKNDNFGDAQYDLGRCYEKGLGVIKDADTAEEWYWKAADNGSREAREKLGFMYKLHEVKKETKRFVGEWIW